MSEQDRPAGQDDRNEPDQNREPDQADHHAGDAADGPGHGRHELRRRVWYRRRWVWGVAGGVVIAAGGYASAALAFGGEAPRGTTVLGTDVGGLDEAGIRDALTGPAAAAAEEPITVDVAGSGAGFSQEVVPSEAGLSVQVDETARELTGPAWKPADLWRHVFGGGVEAPRTTIDDGALGAALQPISATVDVPVVEGAVIFPVAGNGDAAVVEPRVEAPVAGRSFDATAARVAIYSSWPGTRSFSFDVETAEPTVSAAELETALEDVARPAVGGDLTVVGGDRQAVLAPAAFAPALAVRPVDGRARLVADGELLQEAIRVANPEFETAARDAGIEIRDGVPAVVPGVAGLAVPPADLAAAVVGALTPSVSTSSAPPSAATSSPAAPPTASVSPGVGTTSPETPIPSSSTSPVAGEPTRRAEVTPVETQPARTTQQVEDLRIVEQMSTFSTTLTANQARTANIRRAAAAVNGTLLAPGEEFSMNDTVGERTPERGYNRAGVISDGRLVEDYGGGVSQLSTTLFNAVFFAGLDELEHKPHSFYISRYPEGREATIDWRSIDNRFRNDSGHGVYIEAGITGNQVTVSFYGTRFMDVRAEKSGRSAVTAPRTIYDTSAGCDPQSPNSGFTVSVTRIMTPLAGGPEQRETWRTRYNPQNRIVCGPDPSTVTPTPTPSETPAPSTPAEPAPARTPAAQEG